ncbi:MAG UNVERIFIED_CONTAM: hypothetical protein LVR18_46385 [Planctomycetaceae bacterium]
MPTANWSGCRSMHVGARLNPAPLAADTEGLVNQCLTIAGSEAAFIAVELPFRTDQIQPPLPQSST